MFIKRKLQNFSAPAAFFRFTYIFQLCVQVWGISLYKLAAINASDY
ncbi:hypothetical protein [Paenibacillus sp. MMS20-IR301]|nr:hypothetical protein [Paenibacillus sp. MMS20-IR301]WNS44561.1 hypothetical protein LOS79_04605 [Paenibacillus sp. MMS20-IR301]